MPHDPLVSIDHMLNHAREAIVLADGHSRTDLDTHRDLAMLLTHLMEIFGEASARIPQEFRAEHPEFEWQQAADFRNVLIHQFDAIDYDVVWLAVQDELPILIGQLEEILELET